MMAQADGPSQAPHGGDDPRATRVLALVFVTVFLDLIGFGIVIPLMPFYVQSMGGSALTVGILLSCFAGTQFLATPYLGRLSDRVGRRPVILISLAGNVASMVLFAFATKAMLLPLLFLSRIIAGATAGNLSACQAAIADVTQGASRAKGMGRLGAGIGLGIALGPWIGGVLSARYGAWAPPLGAAGMALADLVAAFFLMPETRAPHALDADGNSVAPPKVSLVTVFREPRLVFVLALFFFTFLYMTNLQVALALLTNYRFGWTESQVGNVFFGMGIVMLIVQGLLIGPIAKHFRELHVVLVGAVLSGTGLVMIAITHSVPVLIVGLLLLGLGLGVTQPLLASIAARYAGSENRGALLGYSQSSGGLARSVGPTLAGLLYNGISPGAPFIGGAISAAIVFALAIGLGRISEPPPS
jgi:MFS family permease